MSKCKIDKNVPLSGKPHYRYPLSEMEVGDSFFDRTGPDADADKIQGRIRNAISYYRSRPGQSHKSFVTRRLPGGVRCWRVA